MVVFFIFLVSTTLSIILIYLSKKPIKLKPMCEHNFLDIGEKYWVGVKNYPYTGYLYIETQCRFCGEKSKRRVSETKVSCFGLYYKMKIVNI